MFLRKKAGVLGTLALTAVLGAGCNFYSTGPAPLVSIYAGSTLPVNYALAPNGDPVQATMDRTKEGVVLAATLDEYQLPSVWAKVSQIGSTYYLGGTDVTSLVSDTTKFTLVGSSYYPNYISIGTYTPTNGTATTLVFVLDATGGTVSYSPDSTQRAIKLPDSALSVANQQWYWSQMAAGSYGVCDSAGTAVTVDFTKALDGSGTATFVIVDPKTYWLRSNSDAAWKAGRDASIQFLFHKSLAGVSTWGTSTSGGKWIVAGADTSVADTWLFNDYFAIFKTAFVTTGQTDAVAGASAAE
jgi:hypothetical protein